MEKRLVALLPVELDEGLSKVASAQKRSRGAVVRAALAQYVAAWERQNEKSNEGTVKR